jgi:hypothetical protein
VIELPPEYPEAKLLKKAVRWSFRNRFYIPSLTELFLSRSLDDLTEVGRDWQKAGLGNMIEASDCGRRSVHFALNDQAVMAVRRMNEASFSGRISSIGWSNWIAAGALAVSIIALFKPGS